MFCFFFRQVEARARLRWALGRLGESVDTEGERREVEGEEAMSRTPGGEEEEAAVAAGAAAAAGLPRGGREGALSSPPPEGYFSPRLAFGRPMYESASPRTEELEIDQEREAYVSGTRTGGESGGGGDPAGAQATEVAEEVEQETAVAEGVYREPNWRSMVPILFPPGWRDREIAAAAAGGEGAATTAVGTAENLAPQTERSLERSTECFPDRRTERLLEQPLRQSTDQFPERAAERVLEQPAEYSLERSAEVRVRASVNGRSSLRSKGRNSSSAALGTAMGGGLPGRGQAFSAAGEGGRWAYGEEGEEVEGAVGEQACAGEASSKYWQGAEEVEGDWPGDGGHYEVVEFGDVLGDGGGGGGGRDGGGGGGGGGGGYTHAHDDINGGAGVQGHRTVAHGFTRETFAAEHARLVMSGYRSPSAGRSARARDGTAAPRQATGRNDRDGGAGAGLSRPRLRRTAKGSHGSAAAAAAIATSSSSTTARRRQQQDGPSLGAGRMQSTPARRVTEARQVKGGSVVGGGAAAPAAGRTGCAGSRARRSDGERKGQGGEDKKKARRQRVSVRVPTPLLPRRAQDSVSSVPCCARWSCARIGCAAVLVFSSLAIPFYCVHPSFRSLRGHISDPRSQSRLVSPSPALKFVRCIFRSRERRLRAVLSSSTRVELHNACWTSNGNRAEYNGRSWQQIRKAARTAGTCGRCLRSARSVMMFVLVHASSYF